MAKTVRQQLLKKAALRLGREELAKALNSPAHLIDAWLSGHASMPDRKLLDLAHLLEKLGDDPP